jgi:hypothetical protein
MDAGGQQPALAAQIQAQTLSLYLPLRHSIRMQQFTIVLRVQAAYALSLALEPELGTILSVMSIM